MKSKVNYDSTKSSSPSTLAVGQYWREKFSGDLYLICGDGNGKFWAVCITGKSRSMGDTYDYVKTNINGVIYLADFEYVPEVTITTP